ncbi:hypothetical protein WISP_65015 [Willisornis vidua]|uniref:Uncharacterized protein n=1 Tax=Willisornis vidua TaxID=1566151 RepID=A0ABQ9DFC5_9PASS|nr:hypothetical protein WISP_65015 [Willisornis vidua]
MKKLVFVYISIVEEKQGVYAGTAGTEDGDQLGLDSVFAIASNYGDISSGSIHKTSAPQVIFTDHNNVNVQRIKSNQDYTIKQKRAGVIKDFIPSIAKALK